MNTLCSSHTYRCAANSVFLFCRPSLSGVGKDSASFCLKPNVYAIVDHDVFVATVASLLLTYSPLYSCLAARGSGFLSVADGTEV